MKKGAGICFQLVTVYIQHEKYASVSIPRGFRASNKTAKKKKWCLKRKSVTWIFILRLNKGNRGIFQKISIQDEINIKFKVGHMTEKLK